VDLDKPGQRAGEPGIVIERHLVADIVLPVVHISTILGSRGSADQGAMEDVAVLGWVVDAAGG